MICSWRQSRKWLNDWLYIDKVIELITICLYYIIHAGDLSTTIKFELSIIRIPNHSMYKFATRNIKPTMTIHIGKRQTKPLQFARLPVYIIIIAEKLRVKCHLQPDGLCMHNNSSMWDAQGAATYSDIDIGNKHQYHMHTCSIHVCMK